MSRSRVSGDISLYTRHGIVFAAFGEGRYHVIRANWDSDTTDFLGRVEKDYDVFYFTPCAPGSKCYVASTRYEAVRRYLSDLDKEASHD